MCESHLAKTQVDENPIQWVIFYI